jgi:hypothetical protein
MKSLKYVTEDEYSLLIESGMLFEHYPDATGRYEDDCEIPRKEMGEKMIENGRKVHETYHRFQKWLINTFGKDLKVKRKVKFNLGNGKTKTITCHDYNDYELSKRICGYDVMVKVENYIKRSCPEIRIVHCDDAIYAGSIILLIPHPTHGITVMYIPQLTGIQNHFFLYGGHYMMLLDELKKMETVYDKEDLI